jgi:hypothetical protein
MSSTEEQLFATGFYETEVASATFRMRIKSRSRRILNGAQHLALSLHRRSRRKYAKLRMSQWKSTLPFLANRNKEPVLWWVLLPEHFE